MYPTCSECLFLAGTNFLPLTHYDMLQLAIDCVVFEPSDQTTINFTKTGESTETVSGWILVLE